MMPSARSRVQREPPQSHGRTLRRDPPVDPPRSFGRRNAAEPDIQLTGRQLQLLREKRISPKNAAASATSSAGWNTVLQDEQDENRSTTSTGNASSVVSGVGRIKSRKPLTRPFATKSNIKPTVTTITPKAGGHCASSSSVASDHDKAVLRQVLGKNTNYTTRNQLSDNAMSSQERKNEDQNQSLQKENESQKELLRKMLLSTNKYSRGSHSTDSNASSENNAPLNITVSQDINTISTKSTNSLTTESHKSKSQATFDIGKYDIPFSIDPVTSGDTIDSTDNVTSTIKQEYSNISVISSSSGTSSLSFDNQKAILRKVIAKTMPKKSKKKTNSPKVEKKENAIITSSSSAVKKASRTLQRRKTRTPTQTLKESMDDSQKIVPSILEKVTNKPEPSKSDAMSKAKSDSEEKGAKSTAMSLSEKLMAEKSNTPNSKMRNIHLKGYLRSRRSRPKFSDTTSKSSSTSSKLSSPDCSNKDSAVSTVIEKSNVSSDSMPAIPTTTSETSLGLKGGIPLLTTTETSKKEVVQASSKKSLELGVSGASCSQSKHRIASAVKDIPKDAGLASQSIINSKVGAKKIPLSSKGAEEKKALSSETSLELSSSSASSMYQTSSSAEETLQDYGLMSSKNIDTGLDSSKNAPVYFKNVDEKRLISSKSSLELSASSTLSALCLPQAPSPAEETLKDAGFILGDSMNSSSDSKVISRSVSSISRKKSGHISSGKGAQISLTNSLELSTSSDSYMQDKPLVFSSTDETLKGVDFISSDIISKTMSSTSVSSMSAGKSGNKSSVKVYTVNSDSSSAASSVSKGSKERANYRELIQNARKDLSSRPVNVGETGEFNLIDNEEPEAYTGFMKTLRAEVSGTHSKLRASFHALLGSSKQQKESDFKRYKFDTKTKQMLTDMNLHLKKSSSVECVTDTQLVNDKKLAKGAGRYSSTSTLSSGISAAGKSTQHSFPSAGSASTASKDIVQNKSGWKSKVSSADSKDNTRTPHINAESREKFVQTDPDEEKLLFTKKNEQKGAVSTFSSESVSEKNMKWHPEKKSSLEGTNDIFSATSSVNHRNIVAQIEENSTNQKNGDDKVRNTRGSFHKSSEKDIKESGGNMNSQETTTCVPSNAALAQASAGRKRRLQPPTPTESDASIPWSGIKLRSIGSITASDNVSGDEGTGQMPSWSKVKLRQTNKKSSCEMQQHIILESEEEGGFEQTEGEVGVDQHDKESKVYQQEGNSKINEPKTEIEADLPEPKSRVRTQQGNGGHDQSGKEIENLQNTCDAEDSPSEGNIDKYHKKDYNAASKTNLLRLPSSQEAASSNKNIEGIFGTISSDCLTTEVEAMINHQPPTNVKVKVPKIQDGEVELLSNQKELEKKALVFLLKDRTEVPVGYQEKVIVGSKMIILIHSRNGKDDASVVWQLPRDHIKSLTLDIEAQKAKVLLVEGSSRVLSFKDSTNCLKFANAYYDLSTQPLKHENMVDDEKLKDNTYGFSKLNDEEQKVLETYRQIRRTKPPEDAMRDCIREGSPSDAQMDQKRKIDPDGGQPKLDPEGAIDNRGETSILSRTRLVIPESIPSHQELHSSPLSSISVSTCADAMAISGADLKIAEAYKKMLKMRVPVDAVKHKMMKDNVSPKIVGFVLGDEELLATDSRPDDLSAAEEKTAQLYKKMLKVKVPPEAVRKKMEDDNIDEKIVFAVLGKDTVQETNAQHVEKKLTASEEAIAASYRKMLKLMIPKEAVRHKMLKDQVDSKIITVVLGGDPSSQDVQKEDRLTEEEEAVALSFRKMLKLQIPKDAVKHRMVKEGVSQKIIKFVIGRNSQSTSEKSPGSESTKGRSKFVSLHWTPLSGKELDNSIWRASKKRKVSKKADPEGSDISKLVELFQKKNNGSTSKAKSSSSVAEGDSKAKLLDLTRSNNVAISLNAFKEFTYRQLSEIIENLDPYQKLPSERVQFVRDLLPTPTEIKIIKAYHGSSERLVPAEQWFQHIMHVKRPEEKVVVMKTMETFKNDVTELCKNFNLLSRVCNQVTASEKLQDLLEMVLKIGNIMNEGTRTGGAAGFKFDSLHRLTQTKSSDGKTTVLDYMVTIFMARGQRRTLNLSSDFPECTAASRMLISDLTNEVKAMEKALQKCEEELRFMQKDVSAKPSSTRMKTKGCDKSCSTSDIRLSLLGAIKARKSSDPEEKQSVAFSGNQSNSMQPRTSLQPDIKDKPNADKPSFGDVLKAITSSQENNETSTSPRKNLLNSQEKKDGISRLTRFISEAQLIFSQLKSARDGAMEACNDLSKYLGESGGAQASSTLLGILSEFALSLNHAVKKSDEQKLREKRKKKKKGSQKDQSMTKKESEGRTSDSGRGKSSLVLMVNELLRDASEQTKKDFTQGIVYDEPDERLKAIYERESSTTDNTYTPPSVQRSKKVDIISAIKKRQGKFNIQQVQEVRSKLTHTNEHPSTEDNKHGQEDGKNRAPPCSRPALQAHRKLVKRKHEEEWQQQANNSEHTRVEFHTQNEVVNSEERTNDHLESGGKIRVYEEEHRGTHTKNLKQKLEVINLSESTSFESKEKDEENQNSTYEAIIAHTNMPKKKYGNITTTLPKQGHALSKNMADSSMLIQVPENEKERKGQNIVHPRNLTDSIDESNSEAFVDKTKQETVFQTRKANGSEHTPEVVTTKVDTSAEKVNKVHTNDLVNSTQPGHLLETIKEESDKQVNQPEIIQIDEEMTLPSNEKSKNNSKSREVKKPSSFQKSVSTKNIATQLCPQQPEMENDTRLNTISKPIDNLLPEQKIEIIDCTKLEELPPQTHDHLISLGADHCMNYEAGAKKSLKAKSSLEGGTTGNSCPGKKMGTESDFMKTDNDCHLVQKEKVQSICKSEKNIQMAASPNLAPKSPKEGLDESTQASSSPDVSQQCMPQKMFNAKLAPQPDRLPPVYQGTTRLNTSSSIIEKTLLSPKIDVDTSLPKACEVSENCEVKKTRSNMETVTKVTNLLSRIEDKTRRHSYGGPEGSLQKRGTVTGKTSLQKVDVKKTNPNLSKCEQSTQRKNGFGGPEGNLVRRVSTGDT